jgi:hypothetical protein
MSLFTDAKGASSAMYCEQCCESPQFSCILHQFTKQPASSDPRQKSCHCCFCRLKYGTGHEMYVLVSLVSSATSLVAISEFIEVLRAKIAVKESPLLYIFK